MKFLGEDGVKKEMLKDYILTIHLISGELAIAKPFHKGRSTSLTHERRSPPGFS